MKKNKAQRAKFFVSGRIQGGLLRRMAACWVLYHVALFSTMFLYFAIAHHIASMNGGGPFSFWQLSASFMKSQSLLIVCAVALVPFIMWRLVRATHLIAGPLVRIQLIFQELARGERVQKLKLRDDDLLVDLQDALNEYLVASGQIEADASSEATPPTSAEQDNASQNSVDLDDAGSDGSEPEPKAVISNQALEKLRGIEEMLSSTEAPDDDEYEHIAEHKLHT